jgi:hypothetical protein
MSFPLPHLAPSLLKTQTARPAAENQKMRYSGILFFLDTKPGLLCSSNIRYNQYTYQVYETIVFHGKINIST